MFPFGSSAGGKVANENPLAHGTNIRGTYNLLEVLRENKKYIKSIIIASSDKAYGNYPKKTSL